MQRSLALLLLAGIAADASSITPVQKVIELMNGMMEQGKQEKQAEEVQFAAYKTFCENTAAEKKASIDDGNEKIDMLKADIQKFTSDAARLGREIVAHDDDISTWEGDIRAATKVREIEKSDYDALHEDYSESVSALTRAIEVLKKQAYDRKQAAPPAEEEASLVQVSSLQHLNLIPAEAKKAINIFLQQQSDEGLALEAPEANAYEFQSGKIVDMLEKLQDKFVEERTVLEKEEMNSKHAYDMLMQDLKAQVNEATTDRAAKATTKAEKLQGKADATGDLADTTGTRDEDQKYLTDLVGTCEQKASDFEKRQNLRAEELVAIQKAIDIISSESVTGAADKHLPGLVQVSSFAQLRTSATSPVQQRAASYLQGRAKEINSRLLSALATHVGSDPFSKVKKMIKDLITRLMEEANEEVEHKGWCDTELSTNQQTRVEKTQTVELLHAEIDELEASLTKLSEDLSDLTKAVADLDAAMSEATNLRNAEKTKNAETIADAEGAQVAVAQALTVLKEFYAKAAEATAFLQQSKQEPPEIFDKPYQGMGGESGGVVAMLEVIEQDFARLGADTDAAEASAQAEYATFMEDSKVDKAAKTSTIEHKEAKKQDEEQTLTQKKADLEGTQKELDAALAYFEKLKPSCVDSGDSFEDRVARRKEEIESLQEALKILNGEDLA